MVNRQPVQAKWDSQAGCPLCSEPIGKGDWVLPWIPRWGHAWCVEDQAAKDLDADADRKGSPRTTSDCKPYTEPIIKESAARWCELCAANTVCHHGSSSRRAGGGKTQVDAE